MAERLLRDDEGTAEYALSAVSRAVAQHGYPTEEIHRMTAKTASKRAAEVTAGDSVRTRQGEQGRLSRVRGTLPTMQASARRPGPRTRSVAGAPRRPKRVKRTSGLGGRLAAAMRMARLRASRAAEEFGARR
jgi:hypothetical protein